MLTIGRKFALELTSHQCLTDDDDDDDDDDDTDDDGDDDDDHTVKASETKPESSISEISSKSAQAEMKGEHLLGGLFGDAAETDGQISRGWMVRLDFLNLSLDGK